MAQGSENKALLGKTALVTGGARRVGRAVALRLAQAGMDVAITCRRSAAEAEEVVVAIRRIGRRALWMEADFAEPDTAAHAVSARVLDELGRLDVLVNNASTFAACDLAQTTLTELERNFRVNAAGPALLLARLADELGRHYDPADPSSTGRVVNFVDIHVLGQPLGGYLPYNLSKAALMELTMTASMELAPKVTVNGIAPGVVAWAEDFTAAMRESYLARVPLGRPGTPEDAAAAVLYLVRDAHYCTGQVIKLDGGRLLT